MHLLTKQLEKPQGYFGNLIGWAMAHKNEESSAYMLEKLDVKPTEKLLEVGFGAGRTIEQVSGFLEEEGHLVGLDHSEVMFKQAVQRNTLAISRGNVELYCSCLWDFEGPEDYFDTVYASNVHQFWDNPTTEFRFMRELLKEGGKLVMVFQPKRGKTEEEILQEATTVTEQYINAGFERIEVDYRKMKPATCISIIGYK